jgi:CubicO group peptidase (beta-lactamase class C family)
MSASTWSRSLAIVTLLVPVVVRAQSPVRAAAADSALIDAYVRPYVRSNNFSGQVLVVRGGNVAFAGAYGDADRERHIANTLSTPMHVASLSMQFTAAAVLRLIDAGLLTLDTRVASIVPSVRGGDSITIRNLLEQRSGLSDINARSDYAAILAQHQTPASLVAFIASDTLRFGPGSKYQGEEHSAYNLLALIIEKKTGLPFAVAMQQLVVAPAGMTHSGVDDDSVPTPIYLARGYEPHGVFGLQPAAPIHWSAKAGNGSAYLTARDEARWVHALFDGDFLSPSTRAVVADTSGPTFGYGWFRRPSKRFGEFAYSVSGRAPGFASYVTYLPHSDLTVVVLSNIYSSAPTEIGNDVAAIMLGKPYDAFAPGAPLTSAALRALNGLAFTFPADFYQPNATLTLNVKGREMFVHWPTGDLTPMIPLGRDHFLDRAYWEPIVIERDSTGRVVAMTYDRFRGTAAK